MGFWKSSAVIGLTWGIWHAPIILQGYNYPNHPIIGLFMITILTLLLSPIFSYVRLKAKSVIAASIIHGSFNAFAGLSFLMLKGGNDLIVGVLGLAGFIVLAIVDIGIFLYDPHPTATP
jgi:membrane protease YdiL (CAAX protease family)